MKNSELVDLMFLAKENGILPKFEISAETVSFLEDQGMSEFSAKSFLKAFRYRKLSMRIFPTKLGNCLKLTSSKNMIMSKIDK